MVNSKSLIVNDYSKYLALGFASFLDPFEILIAKPLT